MRNLFKKRENKSLKTRLTIFILLLIFVPMTILTFVNYNKSDKIIMKENDSLMTTSLNLVNTNINDFFNTNKENLDTFTKEQMFKDILSTNSSNEKLVIDRLKSFKESHKDVLNAFISTTDKRTYISSLDTVYTKLDPTTREWYNNAISQKKISLSNPYIDDQSKKMTVTFSEPVLNDKNEIVGVVGIDVNLESLTTNISEKKFGNTGYFYILDKNENVLIHKDSSIVNKPVPVKEIADAVSKNKSGEVKYVFNKLDKTALYETNDITSWTLLATVDNNELTKETSTLLRDSILIMIIILIIAGFLGVFMSNSITKHLIHLVEMVKKVGKGDFTVRLEVNTEDEIGVLAETLNGVIEDLSHLLRNVQDISQNVNASADNLASISEETTASTEEIARTITEIANATSDQAEQTQVGADKTNDLSERIESVSNALEEVSEQFEVTNKLSDKGLDTVRVLTEKSKESAEISKKVSEVIMDFDKSSKEIESIISTIQGIAQQTNLLSLNASIESARAGEAGRGFAVVAQEIRKLAEQSANATNQIKKIVEGIQGQSNEAVTRIEKATIINKAQDKAVEETESIFNEIRNSIKTTKDSVQEITELNVDMVEKKDEITSVMENISASSQQTSASTQEISASTEEQLATIEEVSRTAEQLSLLTEKLNEEIKKFKI